MATCIRIVSSKLCCSIYLKNTKNIFVDLNVINLRKPVQHTSFREKSNALSTVSGTRFFTQTQICRLYNCRENSVKTQLSALNCYEKDFMCAPNANKKGTALSESSGRPSPEKLQDVFDVLSPYLPKMFSRPLPIHIFHPNVILENNFRKTRHVGVQKYMTQLALLRMILTIKFAHFKINILKITKHPEEGTIKCRWRISGTSGSSVIFQFWKFTPGKFRETLESAPTWHDGFSVYYVGSDGLIYKHVLDKMMPDDDHITVDKSTIAPKIALFSGLSSIREQELIFAKLINDYHKNLIS